MSLFIRQALCGLVMLACLHSSTHAAIKDSNVVIQESRENYEFDLQKGAVIVKQHTVTTYRCNAFRTDVPVAEMYNNITSIDDVSIKVNGEKVKNFAPHYQFYSVDDYFFSDEHICFFSLPLEKKGSVSTVEFYKTTSDPRYFTAVYFEEPYLVENKTAVFTIPRWMKVELKEMNFAGFNITKSSVYDSKSDADIITYTIKNLPQRQQEKNSPGPSYTVPHVFVLSKEANVGGQKITYFNQLSDQYNWYKKIMADMKSDVATVKAKANEITTGLQGDIEKVKAVFYWVQQNIRYIAFEDGIAGFRPDEASEVLRKKYGDCKGMANLTKELLKSIGFDARLCWLGTNHIAYDYSTPSMSVDNHMICAVKLDGKTYFLDATESYIGFNEYAERIEGRQVLMQDGEQYILTTIPATTFKQNLDAEKKQLVMNGTTLTGTVSKTWKGEEKEYILAQLANTKKDKSTEAFVRFLSDKNPDYVITNFKTSDINNVDQDLTVSYTLEHKNAVSVFDKDAYLSLDFSKEFGSFIFDTTERENDYWFLYKINTTQETELTVPEGYSVSSMPPDLMISNAGYEFSVHYEQKGNKINYRKTAIIKNTKLPRKSFTQWNRDVQKLIDNYNEQVVLTENK